MDHILITDKCNADDITKMFVKAGNNYGSGVSSISLEIERGEYHPSEYGTDIGWNYKSNLPFLVKVEENEEAKRIFELAAFNFMYRMHDVVSGPEIMDSVISYEENEQGSVA